MTVNELGTKLREMYEAKDSNKTTMIHLFGVIYGAEMEKMGIKSIEVIKAAQMQESYVTEINKGIRLAQYVILRDEYSGRF